jgi:hypothetical protein
MNLQSLSYLCYPETPVSLHSPQGETDVRSPRGYDVAGIGGGEFALWLIQRQRAAPSTGGQVHTHMTKNERPELFAYFVQGGCGQVLDNAHSNVYFGVANGIACTMHSLA